MGKLIITISCLNDDFFSSFAMLIYSLKVKLLGFWSEVHAINAVSPLLNFKFPFWSGMMSSYAFPVYFKNKGSFTVPLDVLFSPVLISMEQTPDETLLPTVFALSLFLELFSKPKNDTANCLKSSWHEIVWSWNVNRIIVVKQSVSTFIMNTCQSWTEFWVDNSLSPWNIENWESSKIFL